ncbi:P27 family phage terminase small subunit [Lacticaseibacillus sharpeae]|jgi:P27 family predicted phage terminase small subunit|nr:P27 family phage terminase small subunit [Lacticaseibacillus sharpeae]
MARKQKILSQSQGHLTVLQQEAKMQAEILAADGLPELQKTPPAHLEPIAKAEYRRIVGSIGKLPLRNLDRTELEAYCTWYASYRHIVDAMNKAQADGSTEEYLGYLSQLRKATDAIKGLASDLGLNVNSRMAMNMPKVEKEKKSLTDMFG